MSGRFIAAIVICPLAAPLVLSFMIVGFDMFSSGGDFLESIFPISAIGVPIAYAVLFFLGFPVFLILKKTKKLSFYSVVASGAFVPSSLMFLVMLISGSSFYAIFYQSIVSYFVVSICGFFVSSVFWLIAYGKKIRIP